MSDTHVIEIVVGLSAAVITGTSSAAMITLKALLKKIDQLTTALIVSQKTQTELLQASHAQMNEALNGVVIDNTRAMTAITVQLDRQTMVIAALAHQIERCPRVPVNDEHP